MSAGLRTAFLVVCVLAAGIVGWRWLASTPDATATPSSSADRDGGNGPDDTGTSTSRSPTSADPTPTADGVATVGDARSEPNRVDVGGAAGTTTDSGGAGLEGRVVDESGRPIAGASVELLRVGSGLITVRVPLGARARSDGSGRFAFHGVPLDTALALEASAAGFAATRVDGVAASADRTVTVRDVVLIAGVRVGGKVRSTHDGGPVPGARITARLIRSGIPVDPLGPALEAQSDAQGDYRLEGLSPETYRFDVAAANFVDTTIDRSFFAARTRRDATFDLTLEPSAGSLAGTTRDDAGQPLADVAIVASATRERGRVHRVEARSDASGAFVLDRLGPWEYAIDATAPHHALRSPVVARASDRTVELTLGRKARLSGTVRFDSGSGIARIDAATVARPGATPSLFAQVPANADGTFVVEDVPNGDIVLDVVSDVGAPTRYGPVAVQAGADVSGIELLVTRGSVASGRVLGPDGVAAKESVVVLLPAAFDVLAGDATLVLLEGTHRKNARCDGAGAFELAGLPDGAYRIRATAPGFAPAYSAVFTAGTTPRIDVGTLRLAPRSSVRGRVVNADGTPVARAIVRAAAASGNPGGVTASDANGEFVFDGLEAGRWTIHAVLPHGQIGAFDEVGRVDVETSPATPAVVTIPIARRE